jgi:small subunit ribosomal protein S20
MPLHKSAEKRLRQSERRNARNRSRKKELKVLVKNMQKLIDTSADKAVVDANKASRKKSQLTRLLNSYVQG